MAAQPGALDFFRRHIRAAAADLLKHQEEDARACAAGLREVGLEEEPPGDRKRLLEPGTELSLSEKVYLLAAFHDALREAERMPAIAPVEWQSSNAEGEWWKKPERKGAGGYWACGSDCADASDANGLREVLRRYVEEVEVKLTAAPQEKLAEDEKGGGKGQAPGGNPKAPKAKQVWLANALLMVRDHPELSDAAIAREIGVNKSTLSRSTEYRTMAGLARAQGTKPKLGYRDKDRGGAATSYHLEAVDQDDDGNS